jgi:hypothetical protein
MRAASRRNATNSNRPGQHGAELSTAGWMNKTGRSNYTQIVRMENNRNWSIRKCLTAALFPIHPAQPFVTMIGADFINEAPSLHLAAHQTITEPTELGTRGE